MNDSLRTIEDYELYLYSLAEQFPAIRRSTLVLTRRGATLARVSGELQFNHGFRLVVRERLTYDRLPALIDSYGYEISIRSSWVIGAPFNGREALLERRGVRVVPSSRTEQQRGCPA